MARPGVTYQEVAKAAQTLVAAGNSPTIEAIRHILGTGSNSTLGQHLRNWRVTQDQTTLLISKENIPSELIATIQGLWTMLMDKADEKVSKNEQENKQEVDTLKREIQNLKNENLELIKQNQDLNHARDWFTNENTALEQTVAHAKLELATLAEKLVSAEQQNQEKNARIDELHKQNQQVQTNLEHYRAAANEQRMADQLRYEQQQQQMELSLQQLRQELTQTQNDKLQLIQNEQQLSIANSNLISELGDLKLKHDITIQELNDSIIDLARKTRDQLHLQQQYNIVAARCDELNKMTIDMQTQAAVLLQQASQLNVNLKELEDQNRILTQEKWMLGQEKAQLLGQFKQLEASIAPANSC